MHEEQKIIMLKRRNYEIDTQKFLHNEKKMLEIWFWKHPSWNQMKIFQRKSSGKFSNIWPFYLSSLCFPGRTFANRKPHFINILRGQKRSFAKLDCPTIPVITLQRDFLGKTKGENGLANYRCFRDSGKDFYDGICHLLNLMIQGNLEFLEWYLFGTRRKWSGTKSLRIKKLFFAKSILLNFCIICRFSWNSFFRWPDLLEPNFIIFF